MIRLLGFERKMALKNYWGNLRNLLFCKFCFLFLRHPGENHPRKLGFVQFIISLLVLQFLVHEFHIPTKTRMNMTETIRTRRPWQS